MICWQRSTHSLQMKTPGPAINRSTWFCCLPQNVQRDIEAFWVCLLFRHINCSSFLLQKNVPTLITPDRAVFVPIGTEHSYYRASDGSKLVAQAVGNRGTAREKGHEAPLGEACLSEKRAPQWLAKRC